MNGNLAYWQLDFTVERKQIWPQITWLCRKNSRVFGGLGGPQTPGLLYSSAYGLRRTAFGRARPTARHYFQIFSSRPGLIPAYGTRNCEHGNSPFYVGQQKHAGTRAFISFYLSRVLGLP